MTNLNSLLCVNGSLLQSQPSLELSITVRSSGSPDNILTSHFRLNASEFSFQKTVPFLVNVSPLQSTQLRLTNRLLSLLDQTETEALVLVLPVKRESGMLSPLRVQNGYLTRLS